MNPQIPRDQLFFKIMTAFFFSKRRTCKIGHTRSKWVAVDLCVVFEWIQHFSFYAVDARSEKKCGRVGRRSTVAEANLQIDLKEITCMVMWAFLRHSQK